MRRDEVEQPLGEVHVPDPKIIGHNLGGCQGRRIAGGRVIDHVRRHGDQPCRVGAEKAQRDVIRRRREVFRALLADGARIGVGGDGEEGVVDGAIRNVRVTRKIHNISRLVKCGMQGRPVSLLRVEIEIDLPACAYA